MIANVIESVIKKNLPIGTYTGYWGGMGVVVNFDGEQWFLKTDVGVKGFNIPASVVVTSQGATVEVIDTAKKEETDLLREAFYAGRQVHNYKGEWTIDMDIDDYTTAKYHSFEDWFNSIKNKESE